MEITSPVLRPCLWFDDQAEAAVDLYTSTFPDSRILRVTRFGREGQEIHGRTEGSVMTIDFTLGDSTFTALNGGPHFTFNEAISLQVMCRSQEEVDHYWERLGEGGDESARQCGWLKDRFGLSWQIIPEAMLPLLGEPDDPRSQRAMKAMLSMVKIDLRTIVEAYHGEEGGSVNATRATAMDPRPDPPVA
jgi:predicted 3-demethylubiquinone-9 3-methyltransferase (glyoxalase superfamily)